MWLALVYQVTVEVWITSGLSIRQWKELQTVDCSLLPWRMAVFHVIETDSPRPTWDGQVLCAKINFRRVIPQRSGGCLSPRRNLAYLGWHKATKLEPNIFWFESEQYWWPRTTVVTFYQSTTVCHMLCKILDIVPIRKAPLPSRNYFSHFTYEKTKPRQVAATWIRWSKPISC